jgi:hypothetical protein
MTITDRRRGRTPHLRKITGGRQDPRAPERPPAVQPSWLSLPAPGCRRCTRLPVGTTLPSVIALGSACAVRAPCIVARDGGTVAARGQMYERQDMRDVMQVAAPHA